jgi:hypothetical protein
MCESSFFSLFLYRVLLSHSFCQAELACCSLFFFSLTGMVLFSRFWPAVVTYIRDFHILSSSLSFFFFRSVASPVGIFSFDFPVHIASFLFSPRKRMYRTYSLSVP